MEVRSILGQGREVLCNFIPGAISKILVPVKYLVVSGVYLVQ